jgi:hypothetical protein
MGPTFLSTKSARNYSLVFLQITVRLVGTVEPTDYHYIAFFNILLRSIMEKLGLDLLGRNYYDQKVRESMFWSFWRRVLILLASALYLRSPPPPLDTWIHWGGGIPPQ